MASILRQIVAGPRARHPEAGLDLCYVTPTIIATSGPSSSYPSLAYRNPLIDLVRFLDSKHGANWCIFEFRGEGTGYPDEEVYNRIWHWPWPDHHPPPFGLVPRILGSMRGWLVGGSGGEDEGSKAEGAELEGGNEKGKRVAVVHCKAGKGRSGTVAVSYMITHEGWTKADALRRFTERRMRSGFGDGVTIPSQLRWIDYVERWAGSGGKMYVERPVEVTEVHAWGLRDDVRIAVEGFVEEGKKIKVFHVFEREERDDFAEEGDGSNEKSRDQAGLADVVHDVLRRKKAKWKRRLQATSTTVNDGSDAPNVPSGASTPTSTASSTYSTDAELQQGKNVIFRPSTSIHLPTSDINLAVERRAGSSYGWNAVTSVAHVWFNCFFEGGGPEKYAASITDPKTGSDGRKDSGPPWADSSGVFTIAFDAMDGIKGSSKKGTRAFDRVSVVWKAAQYVGAGRASGLEKMGSINSGIIPEPAPGEHIDPVQAADWRGEDAAAGDERMARRVGVSKGAKKDTNLGSGEETERLEADDDESEGEGAEGVKHGVVTLQD